MRKRLVWTIQQILGWLQRPVIVIVLVVATVYATIGFIRQEQTVNQLTGEVADRQRQLDDVRQEQQTLQAEIAALNDPTRYAQYASLVARHTLMLTRPDETLMIVNWQNPNDPRATPPRSTDWKALLRAAGIPNP